MKTINIGIQLASNNSSATQVDLTWKKDNYRVIAALSELTQDLIGQFYDAGHHEVNVVGNFPYKSEFELSTGIRVIIETLPDLHKCSSVASSGQSIYKIKIDNSEFSDSVDAVEYVSKLAENLLE